MHVPQHWAKATASVESGGRGTPRAVSCWRWSDRDREEAQALAAEAAAALASRVRAGGSFPERYLYVDRDALREELVESVAADGDRPVALITRNSYGSLVLNTERLVFVDVDLDVVEPRRNTGWTLFAVMFGATAPRPKASPGSDPTEGLRRWVAADSRRGARAYRTAAGFRFLLTHPQLDPRSAESDRLLAELGCDPLYRRLCRAQACYRARLTPKPWRCGVPADCSGFPRETERSRREHERWMRRYEGAAGGFATCRLLETIGRGAQDGEVARLVELHDDRCGVGSSLPLA